MAATKKTHTVHGRRLLFTSAVVAVVAGVFVTVVSVATTPTQSALDASSTRTGGQVVTARGSTSPLAGTTSAAKATGSTGSSSKSATSAPVVGSVPPSDTKATPIVAPPAVPSGATKISALPDTTALTADVVLKPANPSGLADYAHQVSTPGSPGYHHYLPKGAFASQFGPSPQTITAVESGLRSHGLTTARVSADHLTISVRATADQLARGLSTSFSRYRLQDGRIAFANATSPELPADVAGDVQDITGLDNLFEAQSGALHANAAPAVTPGHAAVGVPQVATGGPQPCSAASAASSVGAHTADQVASAYGFSALYGQGDQGQGQSVAVIEGEPNLASDIATYQSCYGTNTSVNYVSVDGGPGPTGAGSGEAALDIEQIIGLAPKASVVVYQSPPNLDNIYNSFSTAITADRSRVISTSWGTCEGFAGNNPEIPGASDTYFNAFFAAENTLFEQAAAQGQSVVAASGDDGSEGCDPWQNLYPGLSSQLSVQDPSAQPYVTGVGGTTLVDSSAPTSESVWNSYHAGGGGISAQWPMPTYQANAPAGVGVINAQSSGTPCLAATGDCRQVPDVAAAADPYTGYAVFWNGGWYSYGGTSAGAPLWAALLALTNASSACGGNPVGFANPSLYATAADDPGAFNDITTGNNDYTKMNAGTYPALAGYDMATGLGTPTANLPPALCNALAPGAPQITSSSSALVGLGTPASVTVTTSGSPTPAIAENGALPTGMAFTDNGDGTATIGGTPSQTGSFPLVLTASNTGSSVSQSFTLGVGTAPAITSADTATFTAGTRGLFDMTTSGTPTPSFTVAGTLPLGLVLTSTGVLVGFLATTAAGNYPVTVTAANGLSLATQTFTLVVDGTPTFTSAASAPFVLNAAGSFTVTTSAAPAPSLTETGALPSGMAFTDNGNGTATISGTPTTSGTFSVTLQASNADGTATQILTLQVLSSVQAPAFTSPDNVTFTVEKPASFQFTATGSPAPTFSIVSGSLPSTISLPSGTLSEMTVTSTGLLSGNPYWYTGGSYHIVVEANNGVAAPAFQSFTLTVGDPPNIYVNGYDGWSSSSSTQLGTSGVYHFADLVLGQPGALTLRATGFPTPTFSESGQLPPGTSFVDNGNGTATISGIPTQPGTFVVTVVANNSAGTTPLGGAYDLSVAPAVAPSFLSPNQGSIATRGPWPSCGDFVAVASGFPTPLLTETGTLAYPEVVTDIGSSESGWDPSTAMIWNSHCTRTSGKSGAYPLTLSASNSAGSATQHLGLTLSPAQGVLPVFSSPSSATFFTDRYNAFPFQLHDGSLGCVFELLSPLPVGITMDDFGLLSGVPNVGSGGTYPLTIGCGAGGVVYARQNFTLNVAFPPAITSPSATSFALAVNSTFTITTDGIPAPALTESGALPSGTSFVDNGNGTATISGAPTQLGSFPVTISAANSPGSASQVLVVTVGAAQAPTFTSAASTTFTKGSPGTFTPTASGIPTPVITESGTLPTGVTFTGSSLSGTTSAGGTYPITFTASNGVSPSATQSFTLNVGFRITTTSLHNAMVGTAYSQQLTTVGGGSSIVWTAISLPKGFALSSTGLLTGMPTSLAVGLVNVRVSASSNGGTPVKASIPLVVDESPVFKTSSPIAAGFFEGVTGTATVTAIGYPAPTFSETGSLPSGVTFNATTGVLSGNPPTTVNSATYPITITASNGIAPTASHALTLSVYAPLIIATSALPVATRGTAYDGTGFKLQATGGVAPCVWAKTAALPLGLVLRSTGVLSGKPSTTLTAGSYSIGVQVTVKDGNAKVTVSKTLTLQIS